MRILTAAILSLSMLSGPALSAHHENASKPSLSASRTVSVAAQVSAIDHASRMVTIETDDGETLEFAISSDVRNLDQVQAGDFVIAQIFQEIDIEVRANPDGLQPAEAASMVAGRAEAGEMPAGVVGKAVVVMALVTAIDLEANTFTLKGPEGNEMMFEAQNPDNLRRAEVGDLVVITIAQSMGVLVERPAGN